MNNLYGQTQVLGKATSTTQSIDNGLFNYVLPYNQNDFFAYSDISFANVQYCPMIDLNSKAIDRQCDENPLRTDLSFNDATGTPVALGESFCYTRELCRNKALADRIIETDQNHSANDGRYLDVITNTNLETLNITNLAVGILVMLALAVSYA